MELHFNPQVRREITEANVNFYASPFKHPSRNMDAHDFIYMIDGEWQFKQEKKIYTLQSDSLLILSAHHRHDGVSLCRPNTKTMYFHVTADAADYSVRTNENKAGELTSLTVLSHNHKIKKIFGNIVGAKLTGQEQKASVLFDLLLCELQEYAQQGNAHSVVERAKNIIHKNPERFFSNAELANEVGISLKGLETKFKAQFGITIHQYMLEFKIRQAETELLHFDEMPIKEIAYNLGFYDEYHFSKQFKKLTGLSPRQYRRERK